MKKLLLCLLAVSALLLSSAPRGECWEGETHKILTDAAVGNLAMGDGWLHGYLDGWHFNWFAPIPVHPAITKERVRDWLRQGAFDEDIPVTRSFYHFHDPLRPWDRSGLRFMGFSWKSSILWSQTPPGQQSYSWKNARQYYYKAMSAGSDMERSWAYIQMFQALGHIMHLVQDAAVPDHTRNDIHILFSVEKWVNDHNDLARGYISNVSSGDDLQPIFGYPANPLAPVRIANLFDTEQYTGANPEITTTPTIGIAEYSNANFLSKGTIFTNYPHPALASTEPGGTPWYLRKSTAGQQIEHFVSARPHWIDPVVGASYRLDDRCHEDYARLLLPKAVQYAAAIPPYFFRAALLGGYGGDEEVTFTYVYNLSNEAMSDGVIEVYARTGSGSWVRIGQGPSGYIAPGGRISQRIDLDCFDCLADYPGPWTIVFRGTLGDERDAVVGNLYLTPL